MIKFNQHNRIVEQFNLCNDFSGHCFSERNGECDSRSGRCLRYGTRDQTLAKAADDQQPPWGNLFLSIFGPGVALTQPRAEFIFAVGV